MSSTPDWMRRPDDPQEPIRLGPRINDFVVWAFGIAVVALVALAVLRLLG
jgi:hypothetical protein